MAKYAQLQVVCSIKNSSKITILTANGNLRKLIDVLSRVGYYLTGHSVLLSRILSFKSHLKSMFFLKSNILLSSELPKINKRFAFLVTRLSMEVIPWFYIRTNFLF